VTQIIKSYHNGRSVAEQAKFMLQRSRPSTAVRSAERYSADAADPETGNYWTNVAAVLSRYISGELSGDELDKLVEATARLPRKAPQSATTPISKQALAATQAAQPSTNSGMHVEEWLRRVCVTLLAKVDRAKGMLDKFKADFDSNPMHALEWSLSTFGAMGEHHVYSWALRSLTDEHGAPQLYRPAEQPAITGKPQKSQLEFVREFTQRELVRRAASPHRSTSTTSNLLEQCLLAAYAELLEMLDRM
jgi:hypothetical protein